MRLKESLKTEWPKLSDSTTRPPVFSTATLISATPTYKFKFQNINVYQTEEDENEHSTVCS